MNAMITKTYTSTLTNTSTATLTREKEGTIINTIVKTFTGPKIQETTFATYTTITTKTVIQSITYRYTTVTSLSLIDKNQYGQDQWRTVYYHSQVREFVPVTVTTPRKIKTVATGLTTLTESTITSYLTEYELDLFTHRMFETIVNTRTFKTIILEISEGEEISPLSDFLKKYGIIIFAFIIIAVALIPKKFFKRTQKH